MLTHIVWWTFKPEAGGKSARENAALVKQALEGLRGNIAELKDISVGFPVAETSTEQAELVLVTRHDDAAGLAAYAAHPEHQKVVKLLSEAAASRKAIDFID